MEWIWQWEKKVYQWINMGWENSFFNHTIPWTEKEIHFLAPMGLLFAAIFFMGGRKTRIFVIWLVLALGFTHTVNSNIIKNTVKRVRPPYTYKTGEFRLHLVKPEDAPPKDEYSFPSGHASFFFALAMMVTCFYPRLWVGLVMFSLALFMGLSRIYVGVHYPFDVLGGMVVGSGAAFCMVFLERKLRGRKWYESLLNRVTFTSPLPPSEEEVNSSLAKS